MENETAFHVVTDGIQRALESARSVAGRKDIRIGGGASTIRQFLCEGLIDESHVAASPALLGRGEPLFWDLDLPALGYACVEHVRSDAATHVVLKRRDVR